ncbi:hypothetical protein A1O7_03545 [Cladophialophora yegresii CBS 114405]|uniref:Clr5 domain-containing protein n=1 Tax=Cladophialophora yegresii CBS 114405 TaxID=1182544 RepID=W9WDM4_9EURO|nr:uncharacterized protein A1O7_03545 [Cladophialophora yegresii CBS 114405]EXJ63100.1 hypothetical protein A1O7_03545 [Cladophialophora yegresii CBS 114405]
MEPRKRNHPHTRREWEEEIRPTFTALYRDQNLKLSEIVDIMKAQGVRAEACHYKTYIKNWGLDKRNKQSDMLFAFQKLQERHGKDTIFSIRGQKRSRHDVEHYWKRRRLNPAEFSPATPGGATYRTPSPCPDRDASAGDTEHPVEGILSSTLVRSSSPDLARMNSQLWLVTSRPTGVRILNSPDSLRLQDQALHYARLYFQVCAEDVAHDENLSIWQEAATIVSEFRVRLTNLLVAMEYRHSRVNAESARLDMDEILPKLAMIPPLPLMAAMLSTVVHCNEFGQEKVSNWGTALSRQIMSAMAELHIQGRSLFMALQAASRSSSVAKELSHRLLLAGNDILARRLGEQHEESCRLLSVMVEAAIALADKNAALRSAKDLFRIQLWKYNTNTTEDNLINLLLAKNYLIECHIGLENFSEAQKLIGDGLRICIHGGPSGWRDEFQSKFHLAQSVVELGKDRLVAAAEFLTKVLTMRLRSHGAGDGVAAIAAEWLKRIFEDQRTKVQVLSDEEAGFNPHGQENVLNAEVEDGIVIDEESHRVAERERVWGDEIGPPSQEASVGLISQQKGDSDAGVGNAGVAAPMAEVRQGPWFIPQEEREMWSDVQAKEWAQQGGQSHQMDWTDYFDTW